MAQSQFSAGAEVVIASSGWTRSPGQFAKVERVTPAGWVVVNGDTFQPDGDGASTARERGGRRRIRIATEEDRAAEALHLLDVKNGRLIDKVSRLKVRDLDAVQAQGVNDLLRAILVAAGQIGVDDSE